MQKNLPSSPLEGSNQSTQIKPEMFRLPRPGERDSYFGLPRTTYYELEKSGAIRLIRLRKRGCQRGTTLIPYDQVRAHLLQLSQEESQ
jgi:hypothetical protein